MVHRRLGKLVTNYDSPDPVRAQQALLACGGVSGQALQPGTVKRVHVVLSSALAQAMRWGWIWDNPAERAHRITVVSREAEPPSPEELVILLDHLRVREPEFYVFVMLQP